MTISILIRNQLKNSTIKVQSKKKANNILILLTLASCTKPLKPGVLIWEMWEQQNHKNFRVGSTVKKVIEERLEPKGLVKDVGPTVPEYVITPKGRSVLEGYLSS